MYLNIVMEYLLTKGKSLEDFQDAHAKHSVENGSDHEPKTSTINIKEPIADPDDSSNINAAPKPKIEWNKASDAEKSLFWELLDENLSQIKLPLHAVCCCDLKCLSENCGLSQSSLPRVFF